MKKLKNKILILICAILLPVSCILFGVNKNVDEVYAYIHSWEKDTSTAELTNEASANFNGSFDEWMENSTGGQKIKYNYLPLYSEGAETLNYYTIEIGTYTGYYSLKERDVSGSKIQLKAGGWSTGDNITYTAYTKVELPAFMLNNSSFDIDLSYTSCNGDILINDVSDTHIDCENLDTQTLTILFTKTCKIETAASPSDITIEEPKLTITCSDVENPVITILKDSNVDNDTYRTINFKAEDSGAGLSSVKYYVGNASNYTINNGTEINVVNGVYSFNANYSENYIVEMTDNVGNISTYEVQSDTINNTNPSISNFKVNNRYNKISYTLNYTETITPHHAEEKYYYAIFTETLYNEKVKSGSLKNDVVSQNKLVTTKNNELTLGEDIGNDNYILVVVARDITGVTCETIATSQVFVYNPNKYTITLPILDGGVYSSIQIGDEDEITNSEGGITLDIYADESYEISYLPNSGYRYYNLQLNDNIINLSETYVNSYSASFKYGRDIKLEAKFRYEVDIDFGGGYTFSSVQNAIRDLLENNLTLSGTGDKDLSNKNIIEYSIFDSENNLVGVFNKDIAVDDKIYNIGTYYIEWNIADEYKEEYVVLSNARKIIKVNPFVITDIDYVDIDDNIYDNNISLTFNNSNQKIYINLDNSNLTDEEKIVLPTKISINYYSINDSEKANPMEHIFNAGEYFAEIVISDSNYTIASNPILDRIIMSKKELTIKIATTSFKYNQENQNVIFSNSGNLSNEAFEIKYKIKENGESNNYIDCENFRNVGLYTYTITLKDDYAMNYSIPETNGDCEITQQRIYIDLTKKEYDYTGSQIQVVFSILDNDNRKIVLENKNNFVTFRNADEDIPLIEANEEGEEYTIIFKCSDSGYEIIPNENGYEIQIIRTEITILIDKEYEFDGKDKVISYDFYKCEGEKCVKLEDVRGITLKLYDNEGKPIESIREVGEYKYKFEVDPKFEISKDDNGNDNTEGIITIVTAKIYVEFNYEKFEYLQNTTNSENLDYYDIEYTIYSATFSTENKIEYTGSEYISLQIFKGENIETWGDVGEYTYTFTSSNDNVKFQIVGKEEYEYSNEYSYQIEIIKRKIYVQVEDNFEYRNAEIPFTYEIVGEDYGLQIDEINYTVGTIRNVGDYEYSFKSTNNNYEIVISNENNKHIVRVTPKIINISNVETNYTFNGQEIAPIIALENPYNEIINYEILDNSRVDLPEIIIKNAGTYSIKVRSINDNYSISNCDLEIVVSPMELLVVVDKNISCEYDGRDKTITYSFTDTNGNDMENIQSYVVFDSLEGKKICDSGEYSFEIKLRDNNYTIAQTLGTINIAKRQLIVSAISSQSKVYGTSDEDYGEIRYTISNYIEEDYGDISLKLIRESGENVGLYAISYEEGSLNNPNYYVSFRENTYFFEITQKKILVMANPLGKTFGEEDCSLTYRIIMDGIEVTQLCFASDSLEGALCREDGENVGDYNIKQGTLNNSNYKIVFVGNKFSIAPRDLHITINDITTTYGSEEDLTYTCEEDYVSEYIFGSITREEGNDVGSYTISKGSLSSDNYNLIVTNGTYTIECKDLYVSANRSEKTYGESEELTYSVSGLIGNDILLGDLERDNGEDVGVYNITLGSLHNDNYNIIYTPNILTIYKAPLTIEFDNKNQVYGQSKVSLTYNVTGLKGDDTLSIRTFRESGEDVGEYEISGAFSIPNNYYIENILNGKYTIEKAKIEINLQSKEVVYNGLEQVIDCDFAYPLNFVYKLNGFNVDKCINAGEYTVQAEFEGNKNYYPAKSKEVKLIINKQVVFISTLNSSFIYDGEIKYPTYSYDKNIGIEKDSFVCKFENDIHPQEVGEYNFSIVINDDNFMGETNGILRIKNSLTIVNEDESIIECAEATFDSQASSVKLIQSSDEKKFNNEKVLSVCTLENAQSSSSNYIYTVKVKALEGVDSVKVYKVGVSGYSEQAIKIENGYYVFKVDNPNDKYIITTEIKTLSTLAWIVILVAVVLIFTITLIIVLVHKRKKVKALAKSKVSDKDIETYNEN